MVTSKRERYIAIATLIGVGLLIADQLMFSPLLARWQTLRDQIGTDKGALAEYESVLQKGKAREVRWSQILLTHPVKGDAAEAQSQVQNKIGQWAREAGLSITTQRAASADTVKQLSRTVIRVTASGTLDQVSRFLWRVQNDAIPARIVDLQINTRKEGSDDLSLSVDIATISTLPPAPPSRGTPR